MKTTKIIKTLVLISAIILSSKIFADNVIPLPKFNRISVNGTTNVILVQGNEYKVEIEGPSDLITTDFKNEKLTINGTSKDNSIVQVTFVDIRYIYVSGNSSITGGEINTDYLLVNCAGNSSVKFDVNCEGLRVENSGISKVDINFNGKGLSVKGSGTSISTFSGSADNIDAYSTGLAKVNAEDLDVNHASIRMSGASEINLAPNNKIIADILGAAKLHYIENGKTETISQPGHYDIERTVTYNEATNDSTYNYSLNYDNNVVQRNNTTYKFNKKDRCSRFCLNYGSIGIGDNFLGFNNSSDYENSDELYKYDMSVNIPDRSISVNLNLAEMSYNILKDRVGFMLGVGVSWNNYKFDENVRIVNTEDNLLKTYKMQNDSLTDYNKSKMTTFNINVPLLLEFRIPINKCCDEIRIGGGVVGSFVLNSYTKNVYTDKVTNNKIKDYGRLNGVTAPLNLSMTAYIGWNAVKLFAQYQFTGLFKENKGPSIYPFTIGVAISDYY
ncbi:MAG: DUF2807 domain-containing protein [Bacteroidales bacterium]